MEFLYTAECIYPSVTNYNNDHSLVIKTTFGGKTFLFAADVSNMSERYSVGIPWLTQHYTNALKCDFLQAPHHGLNGTHTFYDKTAPTYLVMCTHQAATDRRLNPTDPHGIQCKLSYLMNKNIVQHIFVADNGVNGFIPIMNGTTVVIPQSTT